MNNINPQQKKEIEKLIEEYLDEYNTNAQYGVSKVPYHTHNKVDSPPIDKNNAVGNLTTTVNPVNVGSSTPPTLGQALVATDTTHATWQSITPTVSTEWMFTGRFSSLSGVVSWTAGTLTLKGGTTYSIVAGNTGLIINFTYIYFDSNVSTTTLQISTTATDAIGEGKLEIGVALPGTFSSTGNVILNDDFETYSDGNLNGQGSWSTSGGGTFNVESTFVYQGTKAVKFTNTAGVPIVAKTGTLQASGTFTIFINRERDAGFNIYLGEGATLDNVNIEFSISGDPASVFYKNSSGSNVSFGSILANNWCVIEVEWRTAPSKQARYRVNFGTYTSFVSPRHDWTTGLETISIGGNAGGSATTHFYFDLITGGSTYGDNPFQIFGGSGGVKVSSNQAVGANGTFLDGSVNTVTVVNGIITSLM